MGVIYGKLVPILSLLCDMKSSPAATAPSLASPINPPHATVRQEDLDAIGVLDRLQTIMNAYSKVPPNTIILSPLSDALMQQMRLGRTCLLKKLLEADAHITERVLRHPALWDALQKGLLHQPTEPAEKAIVEQVRDAFFAYGWKSSRAINFLPIVMMYYRAFELPILTDGIQQLDKETLSAYLCYLKQTPMCIYRGEDRKHAEHLVRLIDWCIDQISNPACHAWAIPNLLPHIQSMDICATFHADLDVDMAPRARGRMVKALNDLLISTKSQTIEPFTRKVQPASGRKIRIGYMCRSMQHGADNQALLGEIGQFDPDKIEVYLYPRDIQDQVYEHNANFYRHLLGKVTEIRTIWGLDAEKFINRLRKDELDIFVLHDSSSFGFGFYDISLWHRVAPIQIILSRMSAMSTWYDCFDYYLIPQVRDDLMPVLEKQASEKLRRAPGVLSVYERTHQPRADHVITRQMLGVKDDEVLFLCGSAATKMIPAVCETFARILQQVPKSKLALATLHPAHGGERLLPLLHERLNVAMNRYGIDRNRIVILNRLEPQDVPQLMDLTDVYLSQWPLGGSTWIMMCFESATPNVVKDCDLMHGIGNQSLMRSAGFDELVAKDEDGYVKLAVELATDRDKRQVIRERLIAARSSLPHFDAATFSRQMQDCYIGIVDEMAARQHNEEERQLINSAGY